MMRFWAALLAACCLAAPSAGWAQSQPSAFPLATLPLSGIDAVLLDQCASLGPPTVGCVTKQAPSIRVGQPIVNAAPPSSPFLYQAWWDVSTNPATFRVYNGSTWVQVYSVNTTTGIPSFPGNVYLPSGNLSVGGPTSVPPNEPITVFGFNTPGQQPSITINNYENLSGVVGGGFIGFSARGTLGSPGAVQAGDTLTGIGASGFWAGKTTPYAIGSDVRAGIGFLAAENWTSANNNGSRIVFTTTPVSSNQIAEVGTFDDSGNFGLGTSLPYSGITIERDNVAGQLPVGVTINAFEGGTGLVGNQYRGFSARGTSASPTNLVSGDVLASLQGGGFYTGKSDAAFGVGNARAKIDLVAGETWSGLNNTGAYITFSTTANATGAIAERLRLLGSGGLALGTTNDPGAGSFLATGALMAGFSVPPTVENGGIAIAKITPTPSAPGAGAVKILAVAGTNAGTCKLVFYAGTSNTPNTITGTDNTGAGC